MHLFIIDYFISFDTLAPIIYYLKKNKMNVAVCNFNLLQDFSENKIMKYLISMKVKYFSHQPLGLINLIMYYFLKLFIILFPKFILKRCTRLWFFIKRDLDAKKSFFLNEKELKFFLLKNNVKSLTLSENFPINKLEFVYSIAKKNNIKLFLVPSGLALNDQTYHSKRLNLCDKYLKCNNKLIFEDEYEKKNNSFKLFNVGSARYDDEWLSRIDEIFQLKNKRVDKNKLNIAFFIKKGSHWKENNEVENLIQNLKKNKNFQISIRNKPSDILPNKISTFMNDKMNSSEIINWSDVVITGRPSSILVECIKKNKEVLIIDNGSLDNTNFYNYEIFKKINIENVSQYLENTLTKDIKVDEENKKKFLKDFITYENKSLKYHLEKIYLNI